MHLINTTAAAVAAITTATDTATANTTVYTTATAAIATAPTTITVPLRNIATRAKKFSCKSITQKQQRI